MSDKLYGPLDDIYALNRLESSVRGGSSGPFAVHDAELLEQMLGRFLEDPTQLSKLRQLLGDSYCGPEEPAALRTEIAARIARGDVVVRYLRDARNRDVLPGLTVSGTGEIIEDVSDLDDEEKITAWRIECLHHSQPEAKHAPGRPMFDSENWSSNRLHIVPNQGETSELVKVHLRDDYKPTPPQLTAGEVVIPKTGADGGYDVYSFQAEYTRDLSVVNFLTAGFWSNWSSTTSYSIQGGQTPLYVEVYSPKRYAFKFALPPRRAYRAGYRLTRSAEVNLQDMSAKFTENQFTIKGALQVDHGWKPSNQTINTDIRRGKAGLQRMAREASNVPIVGGAMSRGIESQMGRATDARPDRPLDVALGAALANPDGPDQSRPHDPHESPLRRPDAEDRSTSSNDAGLPGGGLGAVAGAFESITYTVDGVAVQFSIFTLIDTFLVLWQQIDDIIEAIQSNAPQVGFFANVNLQLMQGAIGIEWFWCEHTDHRVFRQIDVKAEMTLFNIMIELGIGVSGFGCRAQVFVSLGGDLVVYVDGRRDAPEVDLSAGVGFKGTIRAAVGARFDVGSFVNAVGKGESSLVVEGEIGLWRRQGRVFSATIGCHWTGIRAVVKGSAGIFGVGGEKVFLDRQVVAGQDLGRKYWPSENPTYTPPTLSKSRIKRVMQSAITEGWNVRVRRRLSETTWLGNPKFYSYEPSEIAQMIADRVDRDTLWRRTSRNAEALSHSIRGDLNELGGYSSGMFGDPPRFTLPEFNAYLNGPRMQAHLDNLVDGTRELAKAAGGA